MNSETSFECCKLCNPKNSLSQSKNLEMRIHGQGDFAETRENKQRGRFHREQSKSGSKVEEQKKSIDEHCFCFEKKDFKSGRETKNENESFGNYEEKNYFWDSRNSNWKSKNEKQVQPVQSKWNYSTASPENISEFEEKIDFLFRVFKDYDQKFEDYSERQADSFFKDFLHLFDFNKRLSAAEEGIEKLTLILEDLITKKYNESLIHGDQLEFEEMSMPQRINYLKNKNDLMLNFIKAFFKSGGSEESYLKSSLKPNSNELNNNQKSPKLNFEGSQNVKDVKKEGVMETLNKLRMRMHEARQKKVFPEQQKTKVEKKWENSSTSSKNKLEVISEQAELALNDEKTSGGNEFKEENEFRSLQEKLSAIEKEPNELPLSVTSRILAEEAEYLKSSIDKVHFELFSKPDSIIKKFGDANNTQMSFSCENKKSDVEVNYDSSSEISSVFWSDDCIDKSSELDSHSVFGKFLKQKELKEPVQKEQSFIEKKSKYCCKQGFAHSDNKLQGVCRIPQKNNIVLLNKENRNMSPRCEVRSLPSAAQGNREALPKEQNVRPMTDPNTRKKPRPLSGSKPLPQGKCTAKNSGTNNVKNKNKILLSKKCCVETS